MARFRSLFHRRPRHRSHYEARSGDTTSSSSGSSEQGWDQDPSSSSVPNEFCNAFWGDVGYERMLKKVKTSDKMLENLKNWYKERASAEAEYSKRLSRLSKSHVLSGDGFEGDGLIQGLEQVRLVTARSAHSHSELGKTFKKELELRLQDFITRRTEARKNPQSSIEKLHKKLIEFQLLQEKARKKFEVNAICVNGYSAQLHLVVGREVDRISVKLDKAKANIQTTEKDYRVLTRNLQETVEEWTLQWKTFCDLVQDLEEDRVDFIRASLWDYSNGLSAVSVLEDEQCELIRKALERCETGKDIKQFIAHSGTGAELYRAPGFIDYINGEHESPLHGTKAHQRPIAHFTRNSGRPPNDQELPKNSLHVVRDLVQSIGDGPPPPEPEAPAALPPSSITYVSKDDRTYGGHLAHVLAINAFPSDYHPHPPHQAPSDRRGVVLQVGVDAHPQPPSGLSPLHDPRHHLPYDRPGILSNSSRAHDQYQQAHHSNEVMMDRA